MNNTKFNDTLLFPHAKKWFYLYASLTLIFAAFLVFCLFSADVNAYFMVPILLLLNAPNIVFLLGFVRTVEVTEHQLTIHTFFHTHSIDRSQLARYSVTDYINGYARMRQHMGWWYFSFCGDAVNQSGQTVTTDGLCHLLKQTMPEHSTH